MKTQLLEAGQQEEEGEHEDTTLADMEDIVVTASSSKINAVVRQICLLLLFLHSTNYYSVVEGGFENRQGPTPGQDRDRLTVHFLPLHPPTSAQ